MGARRSLLQMDIACTIQRVSARGRSAVAVWAAFRAFGKVKGRTHLLRCTTILSQHDFSAKRQCVVLIYLAFHFHLQKRVLLRRSHVVNTTVNHHNIHKDQLPIMTEAELGDGRHHISDTDLQLLKDSLVQHFCDTWRAQKEMACKLDLASSLDGIAPDLRCFPRCIRFPEDSCVMARLSNQPAGRQKIVHLSHEGSADPGLSDARVHLQMKYDRLGITEQATLDSMLDAELEKFSLTLSDEPKAWAGLTC